MFSRILRAAVLVLVAGCLTDRIEIPSAPSKLVIHGVLNPLDTMQIVLVERTPTGSVPTPPLDFTSAEPVATDFGVPERDATAEITLPDGQVVDGHEVSSCFAVPPNRCTGAGAGMYKFFIKGASLVGGGTYRLHIHTTEGEDVTAQTIVPLATAVTTTTLETFNRTTDTLALSWPATPRAPAYQLRVESPYGVWFAFTDSANVSLTGALRNPTDANLSHVFIPGFRQLLTVSAVDANLYDYYRTSNNSFTGFGVYSHVTGAYGVFGSQILVSRRNLDVKASVVRPIEGTFQAIDAGVGYIYGGRAGAMFIDLYVESPSTRRGQGDAITAATRTSASTAGTPAAAVGTFASNRLTLVFVRGSTLSDTVDVMHADLHGDTLVGTFREGAPARYVRR